LVSETDSLLAQQGKTVLPFPPVKIIFIPWDFVLILVFLAVIIPWRGAARIKRLMSKAEISSADRLSLYASTIAFQWLLVFLVAWRVLVRGVGPEELGLAARDPWQVAWTSIALTGLLCFNQIVGLRRVAKLPEGNRGSVLAITERILPRARKETLLFAVLALTAGVSEEFLYRGFVFMAFVRTMVNFAPPITFAAILSSIWFSMAHLYQGRRGLITTFVVGLIFVGMRIWTGSLVPGMVAHFGIDLVAGIFGPRFLRNV
jgi:membrane protease YdiL (CAAX protease family)